LNINDGIIFVTTYRLQRKQEPICYKLVLDSLIFNRPYNSNPVTA